MDGQITFATRQPISIYVFLTLFIVQVGCATRQVPPSLSEEVRVTPEGYELVWSDEFNKDGRPNPQNWTYEHGFVRNRELQWYQPENAFCQHGMLVIEGRRERKKNPNYNPTVDEWTLNRKFAEYTSASLTTKGLHSWKFGRFEMRARIDTRPGLWPAFWTMGVEGSWPDRGEIDIMEYYRGMILTNVGWSAKQPWKAKWDSQAEDINTLGSGWAERFHVWRMDWDESTIKLYVDDRLLNTTDLKDTLNPPDRNAPRNPFHQAHYILVNLAIGGSQGGDPSTTDFPARYEIDYVRVYQKKTVE